jgi:predicted DNA-binding antitoxin AbrB/MazE fold protein
MQAYHARYENGQIIPDNSAVIPEGSHIILTVLDNRVTESLLKKQRKAITRFLKEIRESGEALSPEFDAVVGLRADLSREVNL